MKRFPTLTVLTLLSSSPTAHAYEYLKCIGSDVVTWRDHESETYRISTNSFPSGSADRDAVEDMLAEWEKIGGSDFNFVYAFDSNTDGKFKYGDGKNEIMFVSPSTMEDLSDDTSTMGLNHSSYSWGTSEGCFIAESDIIVRNDLTEDDELRHVLLHELGHSIGIQHTSDYGMMVAAYASPPDHPGSSPFLPLPDDRQAMRFLYGDDGSETDISASKYKVAYAGDGDYYLADNDWQWISGKCKDATFELEVTTLNMGTSSQTFEAKYYLSSNTSITSLDTLIATSTVTVGAQKDYVRTLTFTAPDGLVAGQTYYIGVKHDTASALAERLESNNTEVIGYFIAPTPDTCPNDKFNTGKDFMTVPPMGITKAATFGNRVSRTTAIHAGKIKSKSASIGTDGETIYTTLELDVVETFRGTSSSTVRIRHLGGEIVKSDGSGRGSMLEGVPNLEVGDSVVVLLGRNGRALNPFVGGEGGVFRLNASGTVTDFHGNTVTGLNDESVNVAISSAACEECSDILVDAVSGGEARVLRGDPTDSGLPHVDFFSALRSVAALHAKDPIPSYIRRLPGAVTFSEATQ